MKRTMPDILLGLDYLTDSITHKKQMRYKLAILFRKTMKKRLMI